METLTLRTVKERAHGVSEVIDIIADLHNL
jgi:hypothetical protein